MPSISAVHDPDVTAAFPRRPRPGILMGLRLGQVALLAGAVFVGVLALFTSAFPGPTRGVALGVVAAFACAAGALWKMSPARRNNDLLERLSDYVEPGYRALRRRI